MATKVYLNPLNDLNLKVHLDEIDATGALVPVTSGTVTAFLATSKDSTAVAADPSLSVAAVYLSAGDWLVTFDAAILTSALLAAKFASATPYCVVAAPGRVRVYIPLVYGDARLATVS